MDSHSAQPLQAIREQIARLEAKIATLHLLIGNRSMSFDDLLRASNLLGLLGHELDHWRALEELVRRSTP